jgi:hypothetical protein
MKNIVKTSPEVIRFAVGMMWIGSVRSDLFEAGRPFFVGLSNDKTLPISPL